jgi:ABC-2 type transport system permease protein
VTAAPADVAEAVASAPPLARRASAVAATAAVYRAQVARARVARGPLLFVATLQSLGILVLLRGVVATDDQVTKEAVVSGATVLVVAFVALNLLAQRFGALRANRALDHYAALPAPAAAVVLGTAASYATFTIPGAVLTAAVGALLYGLPLGNLWVLVAVLPLAGAALAGLGALLGLGLPRPELATVAGQLGMTLVMFLGVIPPDRLPPLVRAVRAVVPSTFAVDAFAASFAAHPSWRSVVLDLVGCAAVAVVALALATWALRRAVHSA